VHRGPDGLETNACWRSDVGSRKSWAAWVGHRWCCRDWSRQLPELDVRRPHASPAGWLRERPFSPSSGWSHLRYASPGPGTRTCECGCHGSFRWHDERGMCSASGSRLGTCSSAIRPGSPWAGCSSCTCPCRIGLRRRTSKVSDQWPNATSGCTFASRLRSPDEDEWHSNRLCRSDGWYVRRFCPNRWIFRRPCPNGGHAPRFCAPKNARCCSDGWRNTIRR